jgi:hypothetical protein
VACALPATAVGVPVVPGTVASVVNEIVETADALVAASFTIM